MAFKLKTGKTINKILAGGTVGKIIPAAAAFGIGGIESAIGAVATSVIGSSNMAFTGANAMGNVQEDSL